MSRVRQFALASFATLTVTASISQFSRADDQPGMLPPAAITDAPPSTALTAIQVPRIEGVVGAPSKDLLPPGQAASMATTPEAAKPASEGTAVAAPTAPVADVAMVADVPPAFALASELAERIGRDKTAAVARDDREAALKFYDARKGAPVWVAENGLTSGAKALIAEIGRADDYGLAADAFKLPGVLASDASRTEQADVEATLTLAALKYARHARGGRVDPGALSGAIDRKAQLLAPAKVLDVLSASDKPAATLRGFHPQNAQFEKLRLKYVALKAGQSVVDAPPVEALAEKPKGKKAAGSPVAKVMAPAALERKLLANLEMWRWMPDMGTTYIQPNIPEFTVSVVRDGKLVHKERIVTGKPNTMTPIFSDSMRLVVFKPFWNVPESIKYKELQPGLLRGTGSLERAGLRAEINGRVIDSKAVDWIDIDMRQVHIFQPPGEGNALGRVKFLFPNKHDVYLHDTPSKSLFNDQVRAYSHGCMRVRDPLKLAEVILAADKGWTRAQVDKQAISGPDNTEIKLTTPVPVHITYFTAWVDDDGKLQTVNDIYGHEQKIHLGLEGKMHLIAQQREERFSPPSAEERRRFAEQRQKKSSDPLGEWVKSVFNF